MPHDPRVRGVAVRPDLMHGCIVRLTIGVVLLFAAVGMWFAMISRANSRNPNTIWRRAGQFDGWSMVMCALAVAASVWGAGWVSESTTAAQPWQFVLYVVLILVPVVPARAWLWKQKRVGAV